MSSDDACVAQSGNTGHNSVWAMYVLIYIYISVVLGGTLLCQILGYGALSLLWCRVRGNTCHNADLSSAQAAEAVTWRGDFSSEG